MKICHLAYFNCGTYITRKCNFLTDKNMFYANLNSPTNSPAHYNFLYF